MKVKELIEKLKECDPDTELMVKGYEGGVNNLSRLSTGPVALNYYDSPYYGKHEFIGDDDIQWYKDEGCEIITAILLV